MIYLLFPTRPRNIADRGHYFNQALASRLSRSKLGTPTEISPEAFAAGLPTDLSQPSEEDIVVVDAGFIEHGPPPSWLIEASKVAQLLLLAHGRPSANPAQQPETASREAEWTSLASGSIATGRTLAADLREHWRLPTAVSTSGIATCFRAVEQRKQKIGMCLELICVGELRPENGQLDLVSTLASLAALRDMRLTLVGDHEANPGYVDDVRNKAGSLKLEVVGHKEPEDLAKLLNKSHLHVSGSQHASNGASIADSLAGGLPVVAYDVGEHGRWIDDGVNGHLVPLDKPEAYAETLRKVLSDEASLAALSQAATERFYPTWEYNLARFLTACNTLSRLELNHADSAATEKQIRDPLSDGMERYATCALPTRFGTFDLTVYRLACGEEAMLLSMGALKSESVPFVRIHSECFTGEAIHSLKCDCGPQLDSAMQSVAKQQHGAIVYLRQEGRGIGLGDKIRAYAEQQRGADTVEANERIDRPVDLRDYHVAAAIMAERGISRIRINTNNPDKITAMEDCGVTIEEVIHSRMAATRDSLNYLKTKRERLGHTGLERQPEPSSKPAATLRQNGRAPASQPLRLTIFDVDCLTSLSNSDNVQAQNLLRRLRSGQVPVRFMTGDCTTTRERVAIRLQKEGFEIPPEHIYTSASLTARYVREYCDGPTIALCGTDMLGEFEGLELVRKDARTVIVGDFSNHYDASLLQSASRALQNGARLVPMQQTNTLQDRDSEHNQIGLGFWIAGLEHFAQQRVTVLGHQILHGYRTVMRDAKAQPADTLLICKDNRFGNEEARGCGIRTVFLRPGPVVPMNGNGDLQADSIAMLAHHLLALMGSKTALDGKTPLSAM